MSIKITIENNKVILPLYYSQGGIRIADKSGNHVSKPTKETNNPDYFIEWMITNDETKYLANSFFDNDYLNSLIDKLSKVNKFAEQSEYSKRKTLKSEKIQVENFEGFEIYKYTEHFSSFEKTLNSNIKVRITFKLGDYGLEPHPHMYVLIPFGHSSLKLKNHNGEVNKTEVLGSGCFSEWVCTKEDIQEIIITLAHASIKHRDDLIKLLQV